jgi:hypothetical protein
MPQGEYAITLQDVALLLGLKVDGHFVVGFTTTNWGNAVEELLGVTPLENAFYGHSIKMKFLEQVFLDIDEDSCDLIKFEQYVCAYILRLIGGPLFVDSFSSRVSLRYLLLLRNFDNCGEYS